MTKKLKSKTMGEGERLLLTCAGKGTPMPLIYWERDGRRLQDNDIPRLKIKPSKRNVKLSIRNLDKTLHEGTYTCVLTNKVDPPIIASSILSICAIKCMHGERHPRKCRCDCDEGYSGDLCQIPDPTTPSPPTTPTPCDLDCGSNGTLDDILCFCNCNPGFEGQSCSEVLPTGRTPQPISPDNCTLNCGDHGNMVRGSCSCLCDEGYSGSTCANDDVASCQEGTYCFNGGTCETFPNTDGQSGSRASLNCLCPYGFTGELCEIEVRCPDLDCGANGNLSPDECTCICEDNYSGLTCSVLSDNHTIPCNEDYKDFCLNGGTCHQLVGINRPTCKCPDNKRGQRCESSVIEPNKCYAGYCLNNGTCRYSVKRDKRRCICPDLYRGSSRCQYINNYNPSKAPPVVHPSIEQNSMKVIITLTVIFISLLLVLLLVVFIYIKNKNYQEERRKRVKTSRNPLRPPSYNASHPLHQNTNNQAGITSRDTIQELEMEPRRPSAPSAIMRVESEGSGHTTPSQRSHSVDVRYSSVPVQANPVVARTIHNGSARKISQASIHSNRSASSHRSNGSSPVSGKRRRLGYEAVPMNEPADRIEEYHGDTAACEDASIIMLPREEVCSDGESECSSEPDDGVDMPNPQISAIEKHLAQPSEDYDDNVDRDFSADVVNANVHFSNPYAQDDSPSLSPRGHMTSNMSPHEVNLHENPFQDGLSLQGKSPTNKLYSNDGYYGNRYEDEIDRSSPPHAV
ncbi:uncharacterized protein LOC756368 isoform X3 [Strongylocentrotus purpuratus]|uniref:Uncharacterized protein n=1 Tax=Strongylocentrotus purpuratus TaxID=7668 RepID=A0A7M7NFH1_STRPU|nr:uncharacterized protein LOC756368 isoform X3 [Strongylocentrotus purpuratus]